ncbi:MAG: choice-of-anchor L domain-containing protein [Deltaproteobacteria bacterium]|nr:choice-of-anchor L domain-containing protein [Deltaproteobacteria bacterium]
MGALYALVACGPGGNDACSPDLGTDPNNCGHCGNACGGGYVCVDYACIAGECQPGMVEECYTGGPGTVNVGPCKAGSRTCLEGATWSACDGEVTPKQENCTDGIDNDCNGMIDEDFDLDGDGFTSCAGGDCCDNPGICTQPELVNPGAFDAPGNNFDDDCNGVADDTLLLCDQGLLSNSTSGLDFAKAIDICQQTTDTEKRWGVISGTLSLTDGTGTPDPRGHAIRPRFGANALPQGGVSMAILSSGAAAGKTDLNPSPNSGNTYAHTVGNSSPFPADFLAANGGTLPNAPGCPAPTGNSARDAEMLTLRVRVPTNAKSFKLFTNFYSYEFPEWTCTQFNDFFVVLLDSTYAGDPANPADKNLAFFQPMGTTAKVPVGVNLGHGDTGLFTQCVNGRTGCTFGAVAGSISTCISTNLLTGTGFDDPASGSCDNNSLSGGATGWLITQGNVVGGEVITLRIAIWDTSDQQFDSTALIDGLQWSTEVANPGTVIGKEAPATALPGSIQQRYPSWQPSLAKSE